MIKIFIAVLLLGILVSFTLPVRKLISAKDLPLKLSVLKGRSKTLVIYCTGDGGWNKFSQKLTQEMEKEGFGVVTLNCRKYFRTKKTPDIFAKDIEYLLNHYMQEWGKTSAIIVGYSFGADVAAFLPSRLPDSLLSKMNHIALLSPSASTDFVINLRDLIGDSRYTRRKYKLRPELDQTTLPVVCIFGKNEDLKLKNTLQENEGLTIHVLPGSHNYKDDTALIVKMIDL